MPGFLKSIANLLKGGGDVEGPYRVHEIYRELRRKAILLDPRTIAFPPGAEKRLWGFLMEIGYPEAVVTLVAVADGGVSLYFSNGGGLIGIGEHEGPRRAAGALLAFAPPFMEKAALAQDYPLPRRGHVRFHFLAFDGIRTVEESEEALAGGQSPFSPLFVKTHDVITQARLVQEAKERKGAPRRGPPSG